MAEQAKPDPKPTKQPKEEVFDDTKIEKPDDNVAFPEVPEGSEDEESSTETAETTLDSAIEGTENRPKARDYTAFDPDVAAILKKLPNQAYDKFGPKIAEWKANSDKLADAQKELAEVAKGNPRFLHEHPEAYKLTPEYSKATSEYSAVSREADHWRQQLIKIKRGEPWVKIYDYNEDGSFKSTPVPPPEDGRVDIESEMAVTEALQNTLNVRSNISQSLNHFKQQNILRSQDAAKTISDVRAKLWPKLDPAKLTGETKTIYDKIITEIPDAYRHHPLAQLIPLSFITAQNVVKYAKGLEDQVKKLKGVPTTPRQSPRGGSPSGAPDTSGLVDLDAMFGKPSRY